jgi:hypothetical protein
LPFNRPALLAMLAAGISHVTVAALTGCAFLRPGQLPAYRGAMAAVFDAARPIDAQLVERASRALARAACK